MSHSCGCLSGLSSRQAAFLELGGLLEAVIWKVGQVRDVHALNDEPGDAEVLDRMERTQAALASLHRLCLCRGWRK